MGFRLTLEALVRAEATAIHIGIRCWKAHSKAI